MQEKTVNNPGIGADLRIVVLALAAMVGRYLVVPLLVMLAFNYLDGTYFNLPRANFLDALAAWYLLTTAISTTKK